MTSAQLMTPIAMSKSSSDHGLRLVTSHDLLHSLQATFPTADNKAVRPSTPIRHIRENDYTVPAPPPPSPVSFRPEHWSGKSLRH